MSMKILLTDHPSFVVKPDTYAVWIGEEDDDVVNGGSGNEHLVCLFEGTYEKANDLVIELERLFPSFGSYVL